MERIGKAGGNVSVGQEGVRKHLFKTKDGLEEVKAHVDVIDYVLEEMGGFGQLYRLQEKLKEIGDSYALGVIEEIIGRMDIRWYLLKTSADKIHECVDAMAERQDVRRIPA